MELYVGGAHQGKLEYVLNRLQLMPSMVVDGATCDDTALRQASVIDQFHLYLRRLLEQQKDVMAAVDALLAAHPDVILLLDEIGCGIVPMDAFERQYRDVVGQVGCILAKRADHVERVICGIGQVLK